MFQLPDGKQDNTCIPALASFSDSVEVMCTLGYMCYYFHGVCCTVVTKMKSLCLRIGTV